MDEQLHSSRRRTALWVLLALAVLPVFYLHFTALHAADDFYYSTFWMHGPAEFWARTLHHYQNFNGRALVHFVAQTVLAFPTVVFALVNTALLLGIAFLGARLQGIERKSRSLLLAVFFFLVLLLLLPAPVMTQGLLWASASYNYMLPVFLLLLALWMLSKFLLCERKNPFFYPAFVLVQFAAGATTEQSGAMILAALFIYGLCWAVRTRRRWWKLFPAPLLALLGYCTIFLSPATQQRAEEGASLESEHLLRHISTMTDAYLSWDGILPVLLPAGALLLLCLLIPTIRRSLNRGTLALLAGGMVSVAVMLPTGNFDPRTMVPVSLLLLLVSARCAASLLALFRAEAPTTVLFSCLALLLCLAAASPLLLGVSRNYAIELANRAAVRKAQETGQLHYCTDYDTRWCYKSLMFTENSFYRRFLERNRLEDCTLFLSGARHKPVYTTDGQLLATTYEEDGLMLFPLKDIVAGYGGTLTYSKGVYTALLDGKTVKFWPQEIASYSRNDTYQEISLVGKSTKRYYTVCYTADVYSTLFGLDIRPEGDGYVCEKEPR